MQFSNCWCGGITLREVPEQDAEAFWTAHIWLQQVPMSNSQDGFLVRARASGLSYQPASFDSYMLGNGSIWHPWRCWHQPHAHPQEDPRHSLAASPCRHTWPEGSRELDAGALQPARLFSKPPTFLLQRRGDPAALSAELMGPILGIARVFAMIPGCCYFFLCQRREAQPS